MKVKVADVWSAFSAIRAVREMNDTLPAKTDYWFMRLEKKLLPEVRIIEDKRNELIKKYGSEENGQIRVNEDKFQDFLAEWSPIIESDIEVDAPQLHLSLFDAVKTSGQMSLLDKFIDGSG